jgi:hypothetical protein
MSCDGCDVESSIRLAFFVTLLDADVLAGSQRLSIFRHLPLRDRQL